MLRRSQVERMGETALVRFLDKTLELGQRDQLAPCEHGHVECSDRDGGACLDEALATAAGETWSQRVQQ